MGQASVCGVRPAPGRGAASRTRRPGCLNRPGTGPIFAPSVAPFTEGAPRDLVSPRGDAAYTVVTVPTDFEKMADWGKRARKVVGGGRGASRST
jgi:hypothetical protein